MEASADRAEATLAAFDFTKCSHSFAADVRSVRQDRFLGMNARFEWIMTPEPSVPWLFILSADGSSYHILRRWVDPGGLVEATNPVMWRATNRSKNCRLERSHAIIGQECSWRLLKTRIAAQTTVQNVATGNCVRTTDRSARLTADRPMAAEYEALEIIVKEVFTNLSIENLSSLPMQNLMPMSPYLSYQFSFEAKIKSQRFKKCYSCNKDGVLGWGGKASVWRFIPHPSGNGFFIQNVVHLKFWRAVQKTSGIFRVYLRLTDERDEIESTFHLESVSLDKGKKEKNFYAFRSDFSNQYLSAEQLNSVCEKDIPLAWEYYTIVPE